MQLVMRCDDFGYTPVFNMGLKKVFKEGVCSHVELISMTDAIYGTRKYQNHLRMIGSDLCVDNMD